MMKLLGTGQDLLINSTNRRAARRLARSPSDAYKKRWKDMTKGGFRTFLGVHLGTAMLGVGFRQLAKRLPTWVSQLGVGRLLEKLPTDLYRL